MANGNPFDAAVSENPFDQAVAAPAVAPAATAAPAQAPAAPQPPSFLQSMGAAAKTMLMPTQAMPESWKAGIGHALDAMGGKQLGAVLSKPEVQAATMMPGAEAGVAAEEFLPKAIGAARVLEPYGTMKNSIRTIMDRITGAGSAIAKEEAQAQAVVEANISKWRQVEQESQQAQQAATAKNIATDRAAVQHLAEKRAEVEAENKAIREVGARRENLVKMTDQIKPALRKHLQDVTDSVFDNLNERWDAVREKIGDIVKSNPEKLQAGMNEALGKVSGTNRDLFQKIVDSSFGDANITTLGWKDAQAAYTNLGARLAKGGLPGDVYRGLEAFQDVLGAEMDSMAQARGAREDYNMVRKDWSQAMRDLRDVRTSPIAKALTKEDPKFAAKAFEGPLTGPAGKAQRVWAKYQKFGANSYLPTKYRSMLEELKTLPKTAKEAELPAEQTVSKYAPGPTSPTSATIQTHPVDADAIRAQKVSEFRDKALKTGLRVTEIGGPGSLLGYEIWKRWAGSKTPGVPVGP